MSALLTALNIWLKNALPQPAVFYDLVHFFYNLPRNGLWFLTMYNCLYSNGKNWTELFIYGLGRNRLLQDLPFLSNLIDLDFPGLLDSSYLSTSPGNRWICELIASWRETYSGYCTLVLRKRHYICRIKRAGGGQDVHLQWSTQLQEGRW